MKFRGTFAADTENNLLFHNSYFNAGKLHTSCKGLKPIKIPSDKNDGHLRSSSEQCAIIIPKMSDLTLSGSSYLYT